MFRWSLFDPTAHDHVAFQTTRRSKRIWLAFFAVYALVMAPRALAGGRVGLLLLLGPAWVTTVVLRHTRDRIVVSHRGIMLRSGFASRIVEWSDVLGVTMSHDPLRVPIQADDHGMTVELPRSMSTNLPANHFWLDGRIQPWLTTPEGVAQRFPGFMVEVIQAWHRSLGQ